MNERGREMLIQAALSNHRQIKGQYHDIIVEGDCAIGVLHLSFHLSRVEARVCEIPRIEARDAFQLSLEVQRCSLCERNFEDEMEYVFHLNDYHAADFLTIARKLEEPEDLQRG